MSFVRSRDPGAASVVLVVSVRLARQNVKHLMHPVVIVDFIHDRAPDQAPSPTGEAPGSRDRTQDLRGGSFIIHQGVGQANRGGIQPALAREIDADDTSPRARLVDVGSRGEGRRSDDPSRRKPLDSA